MEKFSSTSELIAALVRKRMEEYSRIIEEALETAIQGGSCGVSTKWNRFTGELTVKVDPDVPYGQIHEYLEP